MKAKRVTWYPYSKQTIISKNKMVKIMNRNNGKFRVLTWKASSQTKARLTPSSLFLLSLENLLSTPPTGFFSSPPLKFFLPSVFYLPRQAPPHFTVPHSGKMSSSTTTGQPCPLPPVFATDFPPERGPPHFKKMEKNFPPEWSQNEWKTLSL